MAGGQELRWLIVRPGIKPTSVAQDATLNDLNLKNLDGN